MRAKLNLLISISFFAISAVGAEAATLKPNGSVLINRGAGFEVVDAAVDCHPADRVLVNHGTAHIEYRDGSRLGLIPGQLYVVGTSGQREDDERAGAYHHGHGLHGAPHAAGAPVGAGASGAGVATGVGAGGISTTTLIVGGVLVAGGAAVLINKAVNPSSP